MKAVVYHADAPIIADKFSKDTYKNLLIGLKKNCNSFNIPLVHITINGFEGYGDENIFVDADPNDIVWNREKFFIEYLKQVENSEVIYFTEPDSRINKIFPPLITDLSVLLRGTSPRITPAWRLAKKSALPIFEEVFSFYDVEYSKSWDADCVIWDKLYSKLNCPTVNDIINYNGLTIELRDYKQYCMRRRTSFVSQFKSHHKDDLLNQDRENL
jgi:hypothetical protein